MCDVDEGRPGLGLSVPLCFGRRAGHTNERWSEGSPSFLRSRYTCDRRLSLRLCEEDEDRSRVSKGCTEKSLPRCLHAHCLHPSG